MTASNHTSIKNENLLRGLRALQECVWRLSMILEKADLSNNLDDAAFGRVLAEAGECATNTAVNALELLTDTLELNISQPGDQTESVFALAFDACHAEKYAMREKDEEVPA